MLIPTDDPEVLLRTLEPRDDVALARLFVENHEHLRRLLPWLGKDDPSAQARGLIAHLLDREAGGNGPHAGVWYRGEMIGVIGFNRIDGPNRTGEFGYWVSAAFEGRGLMTTSCRALLRYAFETLKLDRIEIHCNVHNRRSCGIPERLGFERGGVSDDLAIYSMVNRKDSK